MRGAEEARSRLHSLLAAALEGHMDMQTVSQEVIRCLECGLNQFKTASDQCRRCQVAYSNTGSNPVSVKMEIEIEISLKLGDRIRMIRLRGGLTQRQVATRMNCQRTYISKVEHARAIPNIRSCQRIAAALGIEIWQLCPSVNDIRENKLRELLSDPFLSELAGYLPRLHPADRTKIEYAARMMNLGRHTFRHLLPV